MDMAAHAIDLDHPQEDRIIPLYRSDDDAGVEERWRRFAEALGLPMTGAFEPGLVTGSIFEFRVMRSSRKARRRAGAPAGGLG